MYGALSAFYFNEMRALLFSGTSDEIIVYDTAIRAIGIS